MTTLAILTVSDSRTRATDKSGQLIADLARQNKLKVSQHAIVKDDLVAIQAQFLQLELTNPNLIVINGGTGVARKDVTIPAIKPLLQQQIPGFGEAFRQFSLTEIGTRALASQALAGFNFYQQLVYCLPGSTNACQTAMEKLILPEYQHLLFERSPQRKEIHHHAH